MSNPNRVMAYIPKGESAYAVFSCNMKAAKCAEHFRELGYKVRETRFKMGPRRNYVWMHKVSVYYNSDIQRTPDPKQWWLENLN